MPTFSYQAKDKTGRMVSGNVEARDRNAATYAVREMGLYPTGVNELRQTVPATDVLDWLAQRLIYPVWSGVSVKAQMLFFRQLATLLDSGMVLSSAFGSLSNYSGNKKLKRIAKEAEEHVVGGGFFSDVLLRYPWIFTRVQCSLIRAGEEAGSLPAMIDRIAGYLEQEMDIRRMMRASTLYPKLLVVAAFTIPNIRILIMGGVGPYLEAEKAMILPYIIWGVTIYVAFRLMLQFGWFRAGYDTFKISIPLMGALIRKLSMARFGRALALLYSAGVPMAQSIQASLEAVGNYVIRRAMLKAVPQIAQGEPASDALRRTGQVPPMVLDMISTGEKTGNIDTMLSKTADYYEKEAESTVKTFGVVIFVVLLLAVAIMIGMQVVSFYMGQINNTMQQVQ